MQSSLEKHPAMHFLGMKLVDDSPSRSGFLTNSSKY